MVLSMFSVEFCRKMVREHENALSAVLNGQSYSINGRSLTRVDYDKIAKGLETWQSRLNAALAAQNSGVGIGNVVFRRVILHG